MKKKYRNTETSSIGVLKKLSGRKIGKPFAKKIIMDSDFYSLILKYKNLQNIDNNSTTFKNFYGYKQILKITKDYAEEEKNLLGNVLSFKLIFEKKEKIFLCNDEDTLIFWINSFKNFFEKKENLVKKLKNKIISGYRNSIVEPHIFGKYIDNKIDYGNDINNINLNLKKIEENEIKNNKLIENNNIKKPLKILFENYFMEILFPKMRIDFIKYFCHEFKSLNKNLREVQTADEAISFKNQMDIEWNNFEEEMDIFTKEKLQRLRQDNNNINKNHIYNHNLNIKYINSEENDNDNDNDSDSDSDNDNVNANSNSKAKFNYDDYNLNNDNDNNNNNTNHVKKNSDAIILEDPDRYIINKNIKDNDDNNNKNKIQIKLKVKDNNNINKENEKISFANYQIRKSIKNNNNYIQSISTENLDTFINNENTNTPENKINKLSNTEYKKRIGIESPKFSNILILAQRFNKVDNIDEWKDYVKINK
jgi:hypothetical protein